MCFESRREAEFPFLREKNERTLLTVLIKPSNDLGFTKKKMQKVKGKPEQALWVRKLP